MKFASETQAILHRVEAVTQKPIYFHADPSLPHLAHTTMARENAPTHLLRYNPNVAGVNYHVAAQCGYILRLYENPSDQRFEFGSLDSGCRSVVNLMMGQGGAQRQQSLSPTDKERIGTEFFNILMHQLRSLPIGMRIDEWLWKEFPGLREEQRVSVEGQQRTNLEALAPQIRAIAPPPVFAANVSMCAAYALFADRHFNTPVYAIPYRSAGFLDRGRQLLDIFDRLPTEATADGSLVDAWAAELGISDWYTWIPFVSTGGEV